MATRWVYLARYFSTRSGPPNGGFAYTTHSFAESFVNHCVNALGASPDLSLSCANALLNRARYLPRNTRLSTRTGRKKPGRQDTQRGWRSTPPCALHDKPPPLTTQ